MTTRLLINRVSSFSYGEVQWRFLASQDIIIDPVKHIPPESWEYKLIL